MFLLGFCLLGLVSGWIAWRDNPLFSARSTARFLLAFSLMLTVVIRVVVEAARFTDHHSHTAGFTVMAAAVLFGAMAMIWVILLVVTPKSTPLPASANNVRINRRRVSRIAARAAWFALAWAILIVALPGPARIFLGTIGGLFVFLGLVLWFAGYLSARHADRCLSAIESSPWLHWTYSPGQWQQWIATEVARTPLASTFNWRRDGHRFLWPMLAIVATVLLFAPGSLWNRAAYLIPIVLILALLMAFGQRGDKAAGKRVYTTLSKVAPEAYFGEEGVFASGIFTPWLTAGVYLLSASVDAREPRSLVLRFSESTANQTSAVDLALPLPAGDQAEADLAQLQQRLSARCPTATIVLV